MSPLTLPAIRQALQAGAPPRLDVDLNASLACVAMVLAGQEAEPLVCLIRRAERPHDPWSGQMALPGGRAEADDASPQAVAEREAREEVGLPLAPRHLIAPLVVLPVRARGLETGMRLGAFVYQWEGAPPPLEPDPAEVAEVVWMPVPDLFDPALRTRFHFEREGTRYDMPALEWQGRVIWGLTYRVLAEFGARLGRTLPVT
ncbi:MAG TPA: CoA pyrophosphatase [bacterium]|nr:CoA pyrophosphatase [bacterium]